MGDTIKQVRLCEGLRAAKIVLPRGTIHFNNKCQPLLPSQQIDVATTRKGCALAYGIGIFCALCCVTSQHKTICSTQFSRVFCIK